MEDIIQELTDLFSETGRAHHQAYIETDGYDPEWPIWYAEYVMDRLQPLLKADISKSELIYHLVHLSKVQPEDSPDEGWSQSYARYFVEHYP